ncbi:MAG: hypothetical protein IT329_24315 [Caldilineaceae bacterium]|nr:hypothetical protein [Caldilineaceae bacterium]
MKADLLCGAGGRGHAVSCQNISVEDNSNTLGFKGYKAMRTKVIINTGAGFPSGDYPDMAYVYLLPKTIKGPGLLDYAGIVFAVDHPSSANLAELQNIADTFFTF